MTTTAVPTAGPREAVVAAPAEPDADADAAPLLRTAGLRVAYRTPHGEHLAVDGVDVHVAAGELVSVVGESGSGKTTLVQGALGLLPRTARVEGSIALSGVDVTRWSERRLARVRGSYVGYIPQDPGTSLNPVKRIGTQVLEAVVLNQRPDPGSSRAERRDAAVEALRVAGLRDPERVSEQYPHELSGGMKQRCLIAIALAGRPRVIVADEPTSALDVTVQRVILDHLERLRTDLGLGVLLVTHDLGVALDRSDRVVVMQHGRVVEHGGVGDVLSRPRDAYTRRLLAAAPTRHSPRLRATVVGPVTAPAPAPPPDPGVPPLLEAVDVTKTFQVGHGRARREIRALDGVSLAVVPGRTHAIVGESGAGKSTLARLLSGVGAPDRGHVRVGGVDLADLDARARRDVRRDLQFVYQNPYTSLDPRFTVERIVAEPLRAFRVGTRAQQRDRVVDLLEQVALDPAHLARRPGQLSGGQRQRVAIARALALEPRTIVLDEAVSALDVSVQAQILQVLVDLQERLGLGYVFITHDLGVVRQVADDVTVMKDGRVVEAATVDALFDDPREVYTRLLLDAIPGGAR